MRTIRTLAAVAGIAAFSWAGAALAQEGAGQSTAKADVAATHVMPADELTGLNVVNKQGQKLGTINDIVVDVKTGDVRYAALAHGGVAGIGSKLFAIPWHAMTFKFGTPNDQNERHFILDATADHFENAAGFDTS
jgi:sporulation protein YlmC with PRC-barrel domain